MPESFNKLRYWGGKHIPYFLHGHTLPLKSKVLASRKMRESCKSSLPDKSGNPCPSHPLLCTLLPSAPLRPNFPQLCEWGEREGREKPRPWNDSNQGFYPTRNLSCNYAKKGPSVRLYCARINSLFLLRPYQAWLSFHPWSLLPTILPYVNGRRTFSLSVWLSILSEAICVEENCFSCSSCLELFY